MRGSLTCLDVHTRFTFLVTSEPEPPPFSTPSTVVLRDYVRAILNLVTSDTTWILDPRTMHKSPTGTVTPFATGNVVSIEVSHPPPASLEGSGITIIRDSQFNILYRWHSTISKADADWNAKYFKRIMDGKPFDQVCSHVQAFMSLFSAR